MRTARETAEMCLYATLSRAVESGRLRKIKAIRCSRELYAALVERPLDYSLREYLRESGELSGMSCVLET